MPSGSGTDIYHLLVEAIENGELSPGTRLRETELAERFGVSRTPVREGLKQLEAQGLARHEANRGMVIPTLDNDEINELYIIREVLEGTAARLAAQHATEVEIAILKDMVESDQARQDDVPGPAGNQPRLSPPPHPCLAQPLSDRPGRAHEAGLAAARRHDPGRPGAACGSGGRARPHGRGHRRPRYGRRPKNLPGPIFMPRTAPASKRL